VNEDVLGPIDYLAVEYPDGLVTGEGFELILDLVKRDIIRVIDLEFVAKAADGTVRKVALGDIEHAGNVDVTLWQGASSGLLAPYQVAQLVDDLEPLAATLVAADSLSDP